MRKRLFFIVEDLNNINPLSQSAILFSKYLDEEYDVFLFSIQPIHNGRVNENYKISPRVRIKALDVPSNKKERKEYLKTNNSLVKEMLDNVSREGDVFILFSDLIINYINDNCKKILVKGFSDTNNYDLFDEIIFTTNKEYKEECEKNNKLLNKSSVINPFPSIARDENFKFHGNKIICISKMSTKNDLIPLFKLAKGLKNNDMKFSIVLCGNSEYFDTVYDKIIEEDLDDVILLKEVKDIDQNLIESDLMFYFSKDDNYPIYLLEAISSSIPVVSYSKNKYLKEVLDDIGIYASSHEEVIEEVIHILKDKIKLAKLKFRTYEYSKNYRREVSLNKLRAIIEGLHRKYEKY